MSGNSDGAFVNRLKVLTMRLKVSAAFLRKKLAKRKCLREKAVELLSSGCRPLFLTLFSRKTQLVKQLTIAALLLLFVSFAFAQDEYYFRHYQVENGLSHNTVMCSVQDEQGFIWLGTKDGLNRFDGTSFKVFRHDEDDSTTLGNDYVRYLYKDPAGRLFVGTQRGLYRYHPRTESFTHIAPSGSKTIKEALADGRGNLWFIAEGELVRLNEKSGAVRRFVIANFFWANSLCLGSDGTLWVATADGFLKKYNAATEGFESLAVFQTNKSTNRWIEKIYAAPNGKIFIGTAANGVLCFDPATASVRSLISRNTDGTGIFVRDILLYDKSEYWFATESGLFVYNENTGAVTNLKKNYHNPYALSDNAVYTLCKDREGGLWAGTFFGGANYYARHLSLFKKYFPDYSQKTISGNAVREIVKDSRGNLWIGTEDAGLNKIAPDGRITHLMPQGTKNSLAYYNIHGLLAVGDELWVGTFEHGLDVLHIPSGKVVRHYGAGSGTSDLRSNFIFSLLQTRNGEILVGTTAGVFRYRKQSDDFAPVPPLSGYTYDILEDKNGVWWSATIAEGVKFFNPQTGQSGAFAYDSKNKESIGNNMVNSLAEDSKNNLWIATEGGGLAKLSADRKTVKRYTTRNGLPSNFVFKILEDDAGQIWITTSQGLVQMNPATEAVQVFTSANGLLNDQFNYNSGFKDENGRLYFGSVKGMISFLPSSLATDRHLPPVVFTGFQVNNKELNIQNESPLRQSIVYTTALELPYDQSSFSLDFAALSFTAPQMNRYAYKMDGVNAGWTTLEKNRKVYFTDLAPGKYVFRVKSANSSGVWNPKESVLQIRVLPPWWKSPLAYSLYALSLLALAYVGIRYYHRRVKEEGEQTLNRLRYEKEKELYEAKMKFFTNLAHEIKTPLTLIKAPLERVIQKTEDRADLKNSLAIMERNTARLIDLTNQLLDYRQTEAGGFTLNFTEVNVSKLVEEIVMGFRPLAEQKNLAFRLHLPAQNVTGYADSDACTKIISNLFSNAVKYAETIVAVELRTEEGSLVLTVKNDGHLIPADMREKIFEPFVRLNKNEKQKGTGIGLALVRSLTELHGGSITVKEDALFNIFALRLPLQGNRNLQQHLTLLQQNKPEKTPS